MLSAIVSGIARVASSAGKIGGESMETAGKLVKSAEIPAKSVFEIPKPPPRVFKFSNALEAQANGPKGSARNALRELSRGLTEITEETGNKLKDGEGEVKKDEKQRQQQRKSWTDDLGEALAPPQYGPAEQLPNLISKNIEELPQALGESTENTPRTNPT